jgi:hypothetical protein
LVRHPQPTLRPTFPFYKDELKGRSTKIVMSSSAKKQRRLKPLIRKTQCYSKRIGHRGHCVVAELLAEIEYRVKSVK